MASPTVVAGLGVVIPLGRCGQTSIVTGYTLQLQPTTLLVNKLLLLGMFSKTGNVQISEFREPTMVFNSTGPKKLLGHHELKFANLADLEAGISNLQKHDSLGVKTIIDCQRYVSDEVGLLDTKFRRE